MLPWAVGDLDLGDDVLEVGSGPGLTTDVLRRRVPRLTAVEIDPDLARSLTERLRGSNVQVVQADATRLPLQSGRFSAATSFAMLHHVPSRLLQDRLLAELCRVLRSGGLLVGSDAVDTGELDEFHRGDTYVPCDPDDMPARLRAAGFLDARVELGELRPGRPSWSRKRFRFSAAAP
jgi:SAM-dependent methyltransferase